MINPWGVSWGVSWGESWGRRRVRGPTYKTKSPYVVEVDGQEYVVDTIEQARQLLADAQAVETVKKGPVSYTPMPKLSKMDSDSVIVQQMDMDRGFLAIERHGNYRKVLIDQMGFTPTVGQRIKLR